VTGRASGFSHRFAVAQLLSTAAGRDHDFTRRLQSFGHRFFLSSGRSSGFFATGGELGQHDDDDNGHDKCQCDNDRQLLGRFDR